MCRCFSTATGINKKKAKFEIEQKKAECCYMDINLWNEKNIMLQLTNQHGNIKNVSVTKKKEKNGNKEEKSMVLIW